MEENRKIIESEVSWRSHRVSLAMTIFIKNTINIASEDKGREVTSLVLLLLFCVEKQT